jgi:GNAT superfamily N-acetyltransferase
MKDQSVRIVRTDSASPEFRSLVAQLDRELRERDGDESAFYARFNRVDAIAHVVVAFRDGEPVGCGALKKFSGAAAEIKRMFVVPEFRGRGIAGCVLAELEAWSLELGFVECVLETGRRQPEAIRLYEKSGYARIPNYGPYVGVENSVCLKKTPIRVGERRR